MERYFGTYQTFRTVSKKDAAVLMGSNTLVGDRYRINLTMDEGVHRAWLINKFNETIGYFDDSFSRELSLLAAEGLELVGILSFVAFTETPEPGEYWGQAAVIGYSPHYAEEFNRFIDGVCGLIGKGIRPKLALKGPAVDRDHQLERHMASERARASPRETTRHGAAQNATRVHRRPRGG